MLLLNKKDIEKSVDLDGMMDQIEEAYKIFESGAYYMPPRPTVEHDNKTLIYMPCYTKDSLGTKMLTIFPENASLGLPSIDGLVLMNDPKTGKPLAILDGQTVTAYRTGAVGGVGKRLPHGRNCGRRRTGISFGALCMQGERYPHCLCVQSQWTGLDRLSGTFRKSD